MGVLFFPVLVVGSKFVVGLEKAKAVPGKIFCTMLVLSFKLLAPLQSGCSLKEQNVALIRPVNVALLLFINHVSLYLCMRPLPTFCFCERALPIFPIHFCQGMLSEVLLSAVLQSVMDGLNGFLCQICVFNPFRQELVTESSSSTHNCMQATQFIMEIKFAN